MIGQFVGMSSATATASPTITTSCTTRIVGVAAAAAITQRAFATNLISTYYGYTFSFVSTFIGCSCVIIVRFITRAAC